MYYLAKNGNEIGSYVQRIRAAFSRYLDPAMFVVMYVCSGRCPDDSVIPDEFHAIKADQLNFEPGWDYVKDFIQIKVSYDEITLEMTLRLLRSIHRELYDNLIIMHDLDISVDCALVSTRDIIESYITQVLEVEPKDIVSDRNQVGDHCISWLCQTTGATVVDLRAKIYNKFVQMIESTEARSRIGSQLSNFIANRNQRFTQKLLRYKDTGMTRFEITVYGTELFSLDDYVVLMNDLVHKMSGCLTYQISFETHWKSGLVKGNISEQHVRSILANFAFNDRPMHYFVVRLVNNEYTTVRQSRYFRAQGCTSMTFVPGPGNSLVPSKYFIKDRPVLSFGLLGFTTQENITLGWCEGQLKHGQIIDGVQLLEVVDHGETVRSTQHVRDDVLHLNESVNMTTFQADYNVMEPGRQYRFTSNGFGTFRNKEYLCVSTSCGAHVRCSKTLDGIVRSRISEGRHILVRAISSERQDTHAI
ncbi:hypothetical protein VTP01DRAFT_7609 [Rhizomucor pusillus]|uniref:uncharacterized protein n=1 Tax=Rhizomucor pusillus TaxID=4840 RepID=UPI0037446722